jgi:hypothetical protein
MGREPSWFLKQDKHGSSDDGAVKIALTCSAGRASAAGARAAVRKLRGVN